MPLMLKSTLSKPLDNITHTLGDSNMQGYHFNGNTLAYSIQNVHFLGHSEKNTKIVKKKPTRFWGSKSKIWLIQKFPQYVGNILYESEFWFRALKMNGFFLTIFIFREKSRKWLKTCPRNWTHSSTSLEKSSSSPGDMQWGLLMFSIKLWSILSQFF